MKDVVAGDHGLRHVGFKSWLERDHAMLPDFDSRACGLSLPPFTLACQDPGGKRASEPG